MVTEDGVDEGDCVDDDDGDYFDVTKVDYMYLVTAWRSCMLSQSSKSRKLNVALSNRQRPDAGTLGEPKVPCSRMAHP